MTDSFPYRSDDEARQMTGVTQLHALRGEPMLIQSADLLTALIPGSQASFPDRALQTTARLWQDSPDPARDHAALERATRLSLPDQPAEKAGSQALLIALNNATPEPKTPAQVSAEMAVTAWLTHWMALALRTLGEEPVPPALIQAGERLLPHVKTRWITRSAHETDFMRCAQLGDQEIAAPPSQTDQRLLFLTPGIWRSALKAAGHRSAEICGAPYDLTGPLATASARLQGAARAWNDPALDEAAMDEATTLLRQVWADAWPALSALPAGTDLPSHTPIITTESLPEESTHALRWALRAVNQTSEVLTRQWNTTLPRADFFSGSDHLILQARGGAHSSFTLLLAHRLGLLRRLIQIPAQTPSDQQLALLAARVLDVLNAVLEQGDPLSEGDLLSEDEKERVKNILKTDPRRTTNLRSWW